MRPATSRLQTLIFTATVLSSGLLLGCEEAPNRSGNAGDIQSSGTTPDASSAPSDVTDSELPTTPQDAATVSGLDTHGTHGGDGSSAHHSHETHVEKPLQVTLVTTLGTIVIALDSKAAPVSTENFLRYVNDGFYDGDDGLGATTFHRVIPDFMIQGGGLLASGTQKSTHPPIKNESNNGLLNVRGSVAMARTDAADSATSQFFINHVDNAKLNYQSAAKPGYAVFGSVVEGMEVVDAIAAVQTGDNDVPVTTITITDATYTH